MAGARGLWPQTASYARLSLPLGTIRKAATPARRTFVYKSLLLAFGYYLSGVIGAFLAVPPGPAAPIWPPAGIALAAALLLGWSALPGILLGSLLVTYWIPLLPLAGLAVRQSMGMALGLALGACVQAYAGRFLVGRFVGFPDPLTGPRQVWRFLVLAGPVSCLIRPTAHATFLWLAGMIPSAQYPFSWWTGWIGDTVGVIVLAPLILIWTAEPRDLWQRRRISVTVPLVVVLLTITLLFLYATRWEQAAASGQFERRAQELSEAIEKDLEAHLETLYSIQSFMGVSRQATRFEFREYVAPFLQRHPSILALAWNPSVSQSHRLTYEASGREEGFAQFEIKERGANGALVRARDRQEYVPVQYVEPFFGNERALGYDIASDPIRLEALTRARTSGKPSATGWINLAHGSEQHPAFVVFLPIYENMPASQSTGGKERGLLGYATAVFRISDIVAVALKPFRHEDIELTLSDPTTPLRDRVAYFYSANQQGVQKFAPVARSASLNWSTTLDVAARQWVLDFSPTEGFLGANRNLQSWAVGAVGLLISALLGGYLLVATGHTYEVERLVEKLQAKTEELTKANKVREEFLSVMSHELRTPLAVITGYLEVIKDGALGEVNREQREILDRIFEQADDQLTMVNDLLQVTLMESAKIGAEQHLVDLSKFLDALQAEFSHHANESVQVNWDYPAGLPSIITDRTKLKQIIQNLVSNALKYTEKGEVLISVQQFAKNEAVEFKVSDTGIGIAEESLPFLFEKFWQADSSDPRSRGGVGLGLYIVKRFTELLKGHVSVQSKLGKGSTFTVSIPAIVSFPPISAKPSNGSPKNKDQAGPGAGSQKESPKKGVGKARRSAKQRRST